MFALQVTLLPPHFVVSTSQHVDGLQVALAPVQCVVAAAVFNVIRIGATLLQAYPAHVALAVQQLAWKSEAIAVPALAVSSNEVASQEFEEFVLPPHFVASFSQHVDWSLVLQVSVVQFMLAAFVFNLYPAAQAFASHAAFAVQHAASVVPTVVAALANVPVGQVIEAPPHFVVSASQHVESSLVVVQVPMAHLRLLAVDFNLRAALASHVSVSHVAWAVQQAALADVASAPAAAPPLPV
jgi:hypothetical protein